MKRIIPLLLSLLLLTGCAFLAPDEYLSITPHEDSGAQIIDTDAITAEDYESLKRAILSLVRTGKTEGIIHVTNYDGVVEEDLAAAAYEVSKLEPLGAYAVDYMTHSCVQIVSYFEIRISITFRRTAREIAQIHYVSSQKQLQEQLETALNEHTSRLAIRTDNYQQQDQEIPAMVAEYCAANVSTIIEAPQVSVSVYPESGDSRILEVSLLYTHTPEVLKEMQRAVDESLNAAAEYIRYRNSEFDKAQLLFSYLTQRFQYAEKETVTPLYDALCSGVADPEGLAQAWQLICDRADMECYTVSGMRGDAPYTWNILKMGGYYQHLDLAQCVLSESGLILHSDGQMDNYYWNTEQFPACNAIPAAPAVTEPAESDIPEEETPSQQSPADTLTLP